MQKNKNKNEDEKIFSDPYSDKKTGQGKVQKKFVFLFIFVGIIVISFSVWYIGRQLDSTLEINTNQQSNVNINQLSQATNTAQIAPIESLRDKDTDQDGVTDYDELYIYRTSPYIADSDSDKIDDKTEIDQGTDPNCPAGTTCSRSTTATNGNANTNTSELFPELQPEPGSQQAVDLNNLSADQLREVLRDAGASEESLNQLSDEELMSAYQEILGEEAVTTNANTATTNNGQNLDLENITYESLVNLTPAEIRQFLIQGGVPQETLDLIDDETLRQIYLDSLSQNLEEASSE